MPDIILQSLAHGGALRPDRRSSTSFSSCTCSHGRSCSCSLYPSGRPDRSKPPHRTGRGGGRRSTQRRLACRRFRCNHGRRRLAKDRGQRFRGCHQLLRRPEQLDRRPRQADVAHVRQGLCRRQQVRVLLRELRPGNPQPTAPRRRTAEQHERNQPATPTQESYDTCSASSNSAAIAAGSPPRAAAILPRIRRASMCEETLRSPPPPAGSRSVKASANAAASSNRPSRSQTLAHCEASPSR